MDVGDMTSTFTCAPTAKFACSQSRTGVPPMIRGVWFKFAPSIDETQSWLVRVAKKNLDGLSIGADQPLIANTYVEEASSPIGRLEREVEIAPDWRSRLLLYRCIGRWRLGGLWA